MLMVPIGLLFIVRTCIIIIVQADQQVNISSSLFFTRFIYDMECKSEVDSQGKNT